MKLVGKVILNSIKQLSLISRDIYVSWSNRVFTARVMTTDVYAEYTCECEAKDTGEGLINATNLDIFLNNKYVEWTDEKTEIKISNGVNHGCFYKLTSQSEDFVCVPHPKARKFTVRLEALKNVFKSSKKRVFFEVIKGRLFCVYRDICGVMYIFIANTIAKDFKTHTYNVPVIKKLLHNKTDATIDLYLGDSYLSIKSSGWFANVSPVVFVTQCSLCGQKVGFGASAHKSCVSLEGKFKPFKSSTNDTKINNIVGNAASTFVFNGPEERCKPVKAENLCNSVKYKVTREHSLTWTDMESDIFKMLEDNSE